METAYQAFGRMLKSGDLDGVTSFHLLESDIDNFAYCAAYALQDQVRGVSFDTVKRAIEKGQLTVTYLTDAHRSAAALISQAMQDSGFDEVNIDAVGNSGGGIHCATQQQPA